ncbi:hypothetical protein MIND_00523600 [Mycena indigotica]|uniref:Uncharacterized protein n=1 Tax=Mycena indigotica TaxID=2126181 RepID=A0A8H6SXL4_9AGAR|nr:uncharacterized protein MIND_00523600 [Mycena indigotica]KAF7307296.1 hypothetical protein MIND_00523600 [Mycena indigotica]
MADDEERAAKAARAKALLKKRQQKKAATAGVASPTSPPSRSFTPAPSEPEALEEEKRDLGDVFDVSKGEPDTSWIDSLTRVPTPPPQTSPAQTVPSPPLRTATPPPRGPSRHSVLSPPPSHSGKEAELEKEVAKLQTKIEALEADVGHLRPFEPKAIQAEAQLVESQATAQDLQRRVQQLEAANDELQQNQQQTISLLVSEKASLTAELERLEGVESRARATETALDEERKTAKDLDTTVQRLRTDLNEATVRIKQSESKEKEISEKYREQERELQLTHASLNEAKKEAEKQQRKVSELREQIQNDDRLERAEMSLKNTQDRADELEFQLSKLKQAHGTLKTERDTFDSTIKSLRETDEEWKSKHSLLEAEHGSVQRRLETAVNERNALSQEKTALQAEHLTAQQALSQLTEKLQQATSDLVASSRQLQTTQNELKAANRRAEEAEKTQKDLQAEGTTLMRSLDEMRPKIVELTGAKLELGERIDGLQHTIRSRDTTIGQLEGDVDEIRDAKEKVEQRLKEVLAERDKDRAMAQANSGELQKAYAELREELDLAGDSIRSLEAERASHRQDSARRLEEVERLSSISDEQRNEISTLTQGILERDSAHEEEQRFLEQAQNEIESLRAEVAAKDEEIEHLRDAVSLPSEAPSLDNELISSMRQQHALELSTAQSQIRALENSVFDAEAKSHSLRKQISSLEDQLRLAGTHRAMSPSIPSSSRPVSRAASVRAGLGNPNAPLSRTLFDQNLTAETRHKRKVSLSMLKARIDSEVAAHQQHPPSRTLSPVLSVDGTSRPASTSPPVMVHSLHRPHFLDDSHVFWCHSCRGDLVVL